MSIMEPSDKVGVRCPNRKCRQLVYGTEDLILRFLAEGRACPKCGGSMNGASIENIILEAKP